MRPRGAAAIALVIATRYPKGPLSMPSHGGLVAEALTHRLQIIKAPTNSKTWAGFGESCKRSTPRDPIP